MTKDGRFCSKANEETGEICNAIMNEKVAHFKCPKCGAVEPLTVEQIKLKVDKEKRRSLPGQLLTLKSRYATEDGDVIG